MNVNSGLEGQQFRKLNWGLFFDRLVFDLSLLCKFNRQKLENVKKNEPNNTDIP